MKKWIGYLALVAFLGIPANALIEKDRQELEPQSVLPNGGFESGKRSWNITGASTLTIDTSTPLLGKASGQWDASASGEFLRSDLITVPEFLHGRNCEIKFGSTFSGTSGDVTANVNDGTNDLLTAKNIPVTSTALPTSLNFICPTSGGVRLELESTADAAVVELDQVYMGLATNLHETGGAEIAASMVYPATASCNWIRTNTAEGAFGATAACPAPTVVSQASGVSIDLTDDDLPTFKFTSLPPGKYAMDVNFSGEIGSAGADGSWSLRDTTNSNSLDFKSLANVVVNLITPVSLHATFTQTVTGPRNFEIYGQVTSGNLRIHSTVTGSFKNNLTMILTKYPLESQTALTVEQSGWHIDANIGGANPPLGVSSSYININNATLDLVVNSGSSPVDIACNGTELSSGTTCTGDETIGISVPMVPFSGKYNVCFDFSHNIATNNGDAEAVFQVIKRQNNDDTVIELEGNARIQNRHEDTTAAVTDYAGALHVCGLFELDTSGRHTFDLMFEQKVTGTVSSSLILADRNATAGQRDIRVTMFPITQNVAHPVILNSVTTPLDSGKKVVDVAIDYQGTGVPIIATGVGDNGQSGSTVSSVTDIGAGNFALVWEAGVWTTRVYCQCTAVDNADTRCHQITRHDQASNTSVEFILRTGSTGTPFDPNTAGEGASIRCTGN